jgi:hypothetical protein
VGATVKLTPAQAVSARPVAGVLIDSTPGSSCVQVMNE